MDTVRSMTWAGAALLMLVRTDVTFAAVGLGAFEITPAEPGTDAFLVTGPEVVASVGPEPAATTGWPVDLNAALFRTDPMQVVLTLPGHAPTTLRRLDASEVRGNVFLWSGTSDTCAALFAGLARPQAVIACRFGNFAIGSGPESSSLILTQRSADGHEFEDTASSATPLAIPASGASADSGAADDPIDVLVLYTAPVVAAEGSVANAKQLARVSVAVTQLALDNSTSTPPVPPYPPGTVIDPQPIGRVRFVAAKQVAIDEGPDPSGSMAEFVERMRDDPNVVALRAYWGADVVMLLAPHFGGTCDTTNSCSHGYANLPGFGGLPVPGPTFAPFASAVADFAMAEAAPYTFPHEFAHVLGANHAPNTTPNPTPLQPYAFDHYADDNKGLGYRNVMVFGIPNDCPHPCAMQLRYSNPRIIIDDWYHTGLALRDNARLIGETAPITAAYRTSDRIYADDFE